MSFSGDTAVTAAGEDFTATIHPGWDVAGNTNGGYMMAICARAMAALGKPHPVALSAHFLSPGRAGPVRISPTLVREGRRFATVRATMRSADRPLIELLGSFAELTEVEGPVRIDAQPPDLPPPDDCVHHVSGSDNELPALMSKLDLRLHPEDAQFRHGRPSGAPLFRGWLRLPDEPIDPFGLLLAVDAFPPPVFNAELPIAWTPTVELTAHLRGIPRPGWLRCRFSTRFITGGMLEEDGEVWDESGRLVAQSRQLALLPRSR